MIEQGYRGTWNPFTNENHFAEIETCVEEVCISYIFFLIVLFGTIIIMLLTLILCNISEIFYWALKAVPNPTMVTPRIFLPHTAQKITRSRSAYILFLCVFALFYVYHTTCILYMIRVLCISCIICIICISCIFCISCILCTLYVVLVLIKERLKLEI